MMTIEDQIEFEELGRHTFGIRCDIVYKQDGKSCKSKGRNNAKCVRLPNHKGFCEGMGFDEWGPKYVSWKRKGFINGKPLPLNRRLA